MEGFDDEFFIHHPETILLAQKIFSIFAKMSQGNPRNVFSGLELYQLTLTRLRVSHVLHTASGSR